MDDRTNHNTRHHVVEENGGNLGAKVCYHVGEDDVLFGRGKGAYSHEGNVQFRKFVIERSTSYRQNGNKSFRRALAREVIKEVERSGGKFLRPFVRKASTKESPLLYEIVPASLILTKVKQALRDMSVSTLQEPKPNKTATSQLKYTPTHRPHQVPQPPPALSPLLFNSFGGPLLNGAPLKVEPALLNFLAMSQMNGADAFPSLGCSPLAALQLIAARKKETDRLLNALAQQQSLAFLQQQRLLRLLPAQTRLLPPMGTNPTFAGQFAVGGANLPSHAASNLASGGMRSLCDERDTTCASSNMFPTANQKLPAAPLNSPLPSPPLTDVGYGAPLSPEETVNGETLSVGEVNEK